MVCAGTRAYYGGLGQSPQRGPRRVELVGFSVFQSVQCGSVSESRVLSLNQDYIRIYQRH